MKPPKKMKVVDIEDLPDGDEVALITMAVEDGIKLGKKPTLGSVIQKCSVCKRDVWVGPAMQKDLIYVHIIFCVVCAVEDERFDIDDAMMTPNVAAEIKDAWEEEG